MLSSLFGLGFVHWDTDDYAGGGGSGIISTVLGVIFWIWITYATLCKVREWKDGFFKRRTNPSEKRHIDSFWTIVGVFLAAVVLTFSLFLTMRLVTFFSVNPISYFWYVYCIILFALLILRLL